jgi:hypothetical protein
MVKNVIAVNMEATGRKTEFNARAFESVLTRMGYLSDKENTYFQLKIDGKYYNGKLIKKTISEAEVDVVDVYDSCELLIIDQQCMIEFLKKPPEGYPQSMTFQEFEAQVKISLEKKENINQIRFNEISELYDDDFSWTSRSDQKPDEISKGKFIFKQDKFGDRRKQDCFGSDTIIYKNEEFKLTREDNSDIFQVKNKNGVDMILDMSSSTIEITDLNGKVSYIDKNIADSDLLKVVDLEDTNKKTEKDNVFVNIRNFSV